MRTFCVSNRCEYTFDRTGRVIKFSKEDQERLVRAVIEPMASEGLRTICVAYRSFSRGTPIGPNEMQLQGNDPNWEDEAEIVSGLTCLCTCFSSFSSSSSSFLFFSFPASFSQLSTARIEFRTHRPCKFTILYCTVLCSCNSIVGLHWSAALHDASSKSVSYRVCTMKGQVVASVRVR